MTAPEPKRCEAQVHPEDGRPPHQCKRKSTDVRKVYQAVRNVCFQHKHSKFMFYGDYRDDH